ncbi:MAG: hypothetical protein GYA21_02520 [Myxococcales bacterium]|nr:hypothetical protein [Myxococcales bacterium]
MEALQDGRIDTAQERTVITRTPGGATGKTPEVKPYDLVSRERVVRGRMPTLDAIHGRLARGLSQQLCELGLPEAEIASDPAAPQKMGEFLSYQTSPACINLLSIPPLQGTALLCVQPNLFFALLSMAFGGQAMVADAALPVRPRADLSAVETEFARLLSEAFARAAAAAWSEVLALKPAYLRTEVSAEHLMTGSSGDLVMACAFPMRVADVEGRLDLALPYTSLEPVKPRLAEHPQEESPADRERWQRNLRLAVAHVPLRLSIELGRSAMSLRRLLDLQVGQVVRLEEHPGGPLRLFLGGAHKGVAIPVEQNGKFAIEFVEWRKPDDARG